MGAFNSRMGKKRGKKCIAAGCSNSHKDGISLFKFPSDNKLRKMWIKQVQRTRAKWKVHAAYPLPVTLLYAVFILLKIAFKPHLFYLANWECK
jgi:hypothetical protein